MTESITNALRNINAEYYPEHVFFAPKWLVLGVNNTCNLHCKMCDVGVNYTQSNFFENLMGSRPVHMPIELFKKIADQAADFFPNVKLGYAFTEPLIYVHLKESLKYAKSKNLFTSITTNALGLKKWAPVLDDAGLNEINISLDGPPDVHNYVRGNQQSFSKAIEGIQELYSRGSKIDINVYCVITEWNVGRLEEFLTSLTSFNLKQVGFMHANFTTHKIADHHNKVFGALYPATSSNVTDTNNASMNTAELWSEIQEIKSKTWKSQIDFFPELASYEKLDQYYKNPEIFIGKKCQDIFSNVMIKSNGDVIPAHGRCYNLKMGNLYDENLKEIWNSSVIRKFRRTVIDHGGLLPACSRCCSSFTT
jgi:radical SAM protein with 4Fe4S-binding SPASM domain